tara:strand:- start:660 stop:1766 length:1107 start_codon:yes stop_codon:yes gene_type:complete
LKNLSPLFLYKKEIKAGALKEDLGQFQCVEKLEKLFSEINKKNILKNFAFKILSKLGNNYSNKYNIKGLYLYGGVGRGKTLLMDLFYDSLQADLCQRFHFQDFMLKAHNQIKIARKKKKKNPIDDSVNNLIKDGHVICFDEMEVRDIADAMILKRLFNSLWKKGMILVATSNRSPDDLYLDGLHRDRFVPFIKQLKSKLNIYKIIDGLDWRKSNLLEFSGWYINNKKLNNDTILDKIFNDLSKHNNSSQKKLQISSGEIKFNNFSSDLGDIEFKNLCSVPLGPKDYLFLADRLSGLIIRNIPCMGNDEQNEARRFIWLIDALYDRKRFLICSAENSPSKLYTGDQWSFEFERTCSRLEEMSRLRSKLN